MHLTFAKLFGHIFMLSNKEQVKNRMINSYIQIYRTFWLLNATLSDFIDFRSSTKEVHGILGGIHKRCGHGRGLAKCSYYYISLI